MRYKFWLLLLILGLFIRPAQAAAKINVVTTTLELADFVKNIGQDKVSVNPLSTGKYDLHFFEPRPKHVMKLKSADMLVILGMDADIWIKPLIDASRNANIRYGRTGYIDASVGVKAIEIPRGRIDGSMGDVHPYGNPHYWHDLENVKIALENICQGMQRLYPEHKDFFQKNKEGYIRQLELEIGKLKNAMQPYVGTKVVTYHKSWEYFAHYFGLEIIGTLEPKPGVPPSASHVSKLMKLMKQEKVKLMLIEPYYPKKYVNLVAKNTGAKVLRLPNYVGSKEGIDTYLDNLKYNIQAIVRALQK